MNIRYVVVLAIWVPWALGFARQGSGAPDDSCLQCHQALEGDLKRPADLFPTDIHNQAGLTCGSCHGGDPTALEPEQAMSPSKGFVGAPARETIPEFCGSCHASPDFMKKYNPQLRTDQLSAYRTSRHGILLKKGDQKVAVCISCHSVHDILEVTNSTAPVYPTNVADTCGRCHSDPEYMKPYDIPTDQVSEYKKSMHAQALLQDGDLSAPTCNSCHGAHGAVPPGVDSLENVCGMCHKQEKSLFQDSPHQVFPAMGLHACIQCHGNHAVLATGDFMLVGDKAVCTECHQDDKGTETAQQIAEAIGGLNLQMESAHKILQRAQEAGMEVSGPLFDLQQGRQELVLARQQVHSFNADKVKAVVSDGLAVAEKGLAAGNQAMRDLEYRRRGFYVTLGIIVLVVFSLIALVRRLERP